MVGVGANAGIGFETACALASMGATVVMTARSAEKGEAAKAGVAAVLAGEYDVAAVQAKLDALVASSPASSPCEWSMLAPSPVVRPRSRSISTSPTWLIPMPIRRCSWKRPHLLVLDEPTNHLDIDTIDALIVALANFQGGVLLVSHDQHFIESVADEIYVVGEGKVAKFKGDFGAYRKIAAGEKAQKVQRY
jgi:NAD(P)-dependent dehydrogenase (short-subunit alcohol dehydrogenase family)